MAEVEKLMQPQELAEKLGVKLTTLYTWSYRRQIPTVKVGRLLMFSPTAIEKWLAEHARPASDDFPDDDEDE